MTSGPTLFTRFAHPPYALGYCGPSEAISLPDLVAAGEGASGDLRETLSSFAGAWPYLELIANCTRRDPLDLDVVETYWLGGPLLDQVDRLQWGNSIDDRFRRRAGWDWDQISAALAAGGAPTHAFHVFCVYPWVGLLRSGVVEQALHVLDRCRIRWGNVVAHTGRMLLVESRPLTWDGRRLDLGRGRIEEAYPPIDPAAGPIVEGDVVALHWDYVCQRLSRSQYDHLRRYHDRQVSIVNGGGARLASRLEA